MVIFTSAEILQKKNRQMKKYCERKIADSYWKFARKESFKVTCRE